MWSGRRSRRRRTRWCATQFLIESVDAVAAEAGQDAPEPPWRARCHGTPPCVTRTPGVRSRGAIGNVTVEERLYRLGTLAHSCGSPRRFTAQQTTTTAACWSTGWSCSSSETFGHPRDIQAGERFVRPQRTRVTSSCSGSSTACRSAWPCCGHPQRACRGSGRSSHRLTVAATVMAPRSPPLPRTWPCAEASTTWCFSPTWPTRRPTRSTRRSVSKRSSTSVRFDFVTVN